MKASEIISNMKMHLHLLLFILCIPCSAALAESMSDKLLVAIVDKQLPIALYEHKDKPWDMGVYSLKIDKSGTSNFFSTETDLHLSFPIDVSVKGSIKQFLFGQNILIACNSNIKTNAQLKAQPQLKTTGSKVNITINVPIPESYLDCDGVRMPITPLIEQIVLNEKRSWESKLESDINALFVELGI